MTHGRRTRLGAVVAAVLLLAGCATGQAAGPRTTAVRLPVTPAGTAPPTSTASSPAPSPMSTPTPTAHPATAAATSARPGPPPPASPGAPVIVIDPGHSVAVHGTDAATGLDVSDYENEPEMRDVYDVAVLVQRKLAAAGYRVILTKASVGAPTNLGTRADIANAAHAALALSIHDQAGANGGIGFDAGNNIVYYQSVGDYRTNPQGGKVTFTDAAVAALSKQYAQVFQQQRAAVQRASIRLQGNTGYDLGGRGLQGGNIWMVQLLSRVPWIYNEAGGNSAGMVGLSSADKQRYADGLAAAVIACVPIVR